MLETIQRRSGAPAGGPVPPAPGQRARYTRLVMAHGLFITCLADTLAPAVGRATVNVLERAGVEVEFPREQTCCGQMHFNAGHRGRGEDAGATIRRGLRPLRGDRDAVRLLRRARPNARPGARARRSRCAGPDAGALGAPGRAGAGRPRLRPFAARSRTTPPVIRCACSGSATARFRSCDRSRGWRSSNCRTPRSAAASAAPSP